MTMCKCIVSGPTSLENGIWICKMCGLPTTAPTIRTKLVDYHNPKIDEEIGGMMEAHRIDNVIFSSGASSSENLPPLWNIPLVALESYGRRLAKGSVKHGINNSHIGLEDIDFVRERMSHMITHLMMICNGIERGDNDLDANIDAVVWGAGFLCEVHDHNPETLKKAFYRGWRGEYGKCTAVRVKGEGGGNTVRPGYVAKNPVDGRVGHGPDPSNE